MDEDAQQLPILPDEIIVPHRVTEESEQMPPKREQPLVVLEEFMFLRPETPDRLLPTFDFW